jgi:hypothetical protein
MVPCDGVEVRRPMGGVRELSRLGRASYSRPDQIQATAIAGAPKKSAPEIIIGSTLITDEKGIRFRTDIFLTVSNRSGIKKARAAP